MKGHSSQFIIRATVIPHSIKLAIVVKKPTGEVVCYIPDSLAEVLLPLLTSGEMEGITGLSRGAAGGDDCKEVGWSFPAPDSTGQKVEQAHHL